MLDVRRLGRGVTTEAQGQLEAVSDAALQGLCTHVMPAIRHTKEHQTHGNK